jgi:hypothetical protein
MSDAAMATRPSCHQRRVDARCRARSAANWSTFALFPGITPAGTASNDDRIRDEAAMRPRASATIAAQSAHDDAADSTRADSSGVNASSSQAWIVPSSRCSCLSVMISSLSTGGTPFVALL